MNESEHRVASRYSDLKEVYQKLFWENWDEQMWISKIEWTVKDNSADDKEPFFSVAHDLHWNVSNIKALLYACIPYIYKKVQKN